MTMEEVIDIINKEKLLGYNLFEDRYHNENELVIFKKKQWIVYATDERASKVTGSEQSFSNESDALKSFIKRLQALNELRKMKCED